MTNSNPQSGGSQDSIDSLDDILALIKYDIEYATTHGGCPPAVKAIRRSGVAEAKERLAAWHNTQLKQHTAAVENKARQDELNQLEALYKRYEQGNFWEYAVYSGDIEKRIAELSGEEK
jgi:hypothetical protein